MPKKKRKKDMSHINSVDDVYAEILQTQYRCLPIRVEFEETSKKSSFKVWDKEPKRTVEIDDAAKERRTKKYKRLLDDLFKSKKQMIRCKNRKKKLEMKLQVAKKEAYVGMYYGRDSSTMEDAIKAFEELSHCESVGQEAKEWLGRIRIIPEGFLWMTEVEKDDEIEKGLQFFGYVMGGTFQSINAQKKRHLKLISDQFKAFSSNCNSSKYAEIIEEFLGSSELKDQIKMYNKQQPLRICFRCIFVEEEGQVLCSIEGRRRGGYMVIPLSSTYKDPCPFCGHNLHINPSDCTFYFSCPVDVNCENEGSPTLNDSFSTAAEHIGTRHCWNQKYIVGLLEEYKVQYERYREKNPDAPSIPECEIDLLELEPEPASRKCAQCEKLAGINAMVCAGCDPEDENAAIYCDKKCARAHWPNHKKLCKRVDIDIKKDKIDKDPTLADSTQTELAPTKCSNCGHNEMEYIMRCVGCEKNEFAAVYCSSRCQRAHWKQHKKVCARLDKKRKAETAV